MSFADHTVNRDDFVVIVPASKKDPAHEAFRAWLDDQGLRREDIPDDDLLIDVGRDTDGGTFYRFLVHRRWVEQ